MSSDRPLLLVADDQLSVRRLIEEVFSEIGYRVHHAANGQEATQLAVAEAPDIVLLDMRMPVMDGMDTLKAVKSVHPGMIIFMMTAVGDEAHLAELVAAGAHSCISKPFDVFALRDRIRAALREGGAG